MNTISSFSTILFFFLGVSLIFFCASIFTGIKREAFGIQKVAKYYYTGTIFTGLALLLTLTFGNGLTAEAFIFPLFLIIVMIIFFKVHIFIQKKTEEIVGDIGFLSLISRIKNFFKLIGNNDSSPKRPKE